MSGVVISESSLADSASDIDLEGSRIVWGSSSSVVDVHDNWRVERAKRLNALKAGPDRYIKDCCRNLESFYDSVDSVFSAIKKAQDPHIDSLIVQEAAPVILSQLAAIKQDLSYHPLVAHDVDHEELMKIKVQFEKDGLSVEDEIWQINSRTLASAIDNLESFLENLDPKNVRLDVLENLIIRAETHMFYNLTQYNIQEQGITGVTPDGRLMNIPFEYLVNKMGLEAINFDMDDCLFMSEAVQEQSWLDALDLACQNGEISSKAAIDAKAYAKHCFDTYNMKTLSKGVFDRVIKHSQGYPVIENFKTSLEFDRYLVEQRVEVLSFAAKEGKIRLVLNARNLIKECNKHGLEVSIGTSSDQKIAEKLLHLLFDDGVVNDFGDGLGIDDLIPVENRVFGDQVKQRKPATEIFEKANRTTGIPFDKAATIDDNLATSLNAVSEDYDYSGTQMSFAASIALFKERDRLPQYEEAFLSQDSDVSRRVVVLKNINYILLGHQNPFFSQKKDEVAKVL